MNSKVAVGADEVAAQVAVEHLNWSEERAAEEVERYRRYITRMTPRSLSLSAEATSADAVSASVTS